MRNLARTGLVILVASGLGGCLSTDDAYPVAGNPVNPTPVGDYRVQCQSHPSVLNVIDPDFETACQQVIGPRRVVVRARG